MGGGFGTGRSEIAQGLIIDRLPSGGNASGRRVGQVFGAFEDMAFQNFFEYFDGAYFVRHSLPILFEGRAQAVDFG